MLMVCELFCGLCAKRVALPVKTLRGQRGQSQCWRIALTQNPNPGQVLFEAQGRGGKNKAVDMEDMKFHQCVRAHCPDPKP